MPDIHTPATEPPVAVGLAVYNSERYVAQSIEGLLAQSYGDFVLFISDNASTDRTSEICQSFAARDSRIRYSKNPTNIGMAGNYNLLFSLCRSKYFRWATADDYWDADMLKDAVEVMEADPSLALCYPRAIFVDADGSPLSKWQDELHLLQDDPVERFMGVVSNIVRVHHHLGLMRADTMRKTRLLGRHTGSDVGFVAEMSLYGKFHQIPKYQMYRRVHEDSSSVKPQDHAQQQRRYHAANVRRVLFNHWIYMRVLFGAVARSPLPGADKRKLYGHLVKRVYWERERLIHEGLADIGWLLRGRK